MRILLFFFLVVAVPLSAQNPNQTGGQRDSTRARGGMMRDTAAFRNMPLTGKVIGSLRDSSTRQPVEFASVALLRARDTSIAGGALSDDRGNFRIEDQSPGRYFIRITSIGYRQLDSKPFMINPAEPLKDFGTVWLTPATRVLKETEVVGEKIEFVNSLDKKVYNVDKTLINAGGSVSEVLQNIPSVNVDIDGRISLRGSEQVTVLIDGKPAGLTGDNRGAILQQLPANSIDQIEVITNPSAKYDAEGMSGIINIKTRKDKNLGLNGSVTLGAGTRDKYNASLQLNRRTKTHNAFFNYGYRDDRRFFYGDNTRMNTFGERISYLVSDNDGYNDNRSHNLRGGVDLYLNDYNTLGFSGGMNMRKEDRRDLAVTLNQDENRFVRSGFSRLTTRDEDNRIIDAAVDYRRTFPGTRKEISGSASINRNERDNRDLFNTDNFFTDTTLAAFNQLQRVNNESVSWNGVAQIDLVFPKEKFKLETGLKSTFRQSDGSQGSDRFYDGRWNIDTGFADRFVFDEWVHAAYFNWTGRWKIFDLSVGLRAEQTFITGDSKSRDTSFTRDFLNLFPSAAIKYTFSEGKDLQLSYSRRINRPREGQLNPFQNISDSINIFIGNPAILPELTHSLELGYVGRYNEQSVSASLFYRYTDDFSQRFRTIDTVTNVTTQTFVNYSTAENLGFELVFRNSFLKVVTTSLTITAFYNTVNGTNLGANLVSDVWSGDARGSVAVKVNKALSLQLTGNYMAPREQPQGTFQGMNGVDFGFKYDFKGGKFSLNGSVSDIFDTRNFRVENYGDGFRVDFLRKRESRVGSFTLSYRFGKAEQMRDRRRGNRGGEQMPQNDMMDF